MSTGQFQNNEELYQLLTFFFFPRKGCITVHTNCIKKNETFHLTLILYFPSMHLIALRKRHLTLNFKDVSVEAHEDFVA